MSLVINDNTKLTEILVNHAINTKYEDIPEPALMVQRKSFIDMLGVMLAATTLDYSGPLFADYAVSWAEGKCSILGRNKKTLPMFAAMANGSLTHAIDYEDSHDVAPVHPNSTSFPAVMALCQHLGGVSGKEFLATMAVSSDICCRLDLAGNEDLLKFGWYSPPIHGTIAATVASGRTLKLNEKQMMDAIAMGACQFTCIAECSNSKSSAIRTVREGFAAHAGVQAAFLAKCGVPAAINTLLEGKLGYYHAYTHDNYTPERFSAGIGEVYENVNVGFKPWPACRVTHTSIDGLLDLVERYDIKPDEVENIHIILQEAGRMIVEPRESKYRPSSPSIAKMSLPFVAGNAIVYRSVDLGSFMPDRLNDPKVLEIADKLTAEIEPSWSKEENKKAIVRIKTKRGVFTADRDVCLGCTDNPMPEKDFYKKFMDCASFSKKPYKKSLLDEVYEKAMTMDNLADMNEIFDLL